MEQNWYVDEDMKGEQLGKFSSDEDDHKQKYMQVLHQRRSNRQSTELGLFLADS